MKNTWITSDLHLGHNRDFIWSSRGFDSIEAHDEAIIKNINEVVEEKSTLYILGDLLLGDNIAGIEKLKQIKCQNIYIALGNHCTSTREVLYQNLPQVKDVQLCYRIKSGKWSFILSHYPTIVTNGDDPKKVVNLCGHSHTSDPWLHWEIAKAYHIELDAHNNFPINLETIKQEIINHNKN